MSKTFTICTYPIVAALKAADRFLERMEWTPKTETQQVFLEMFWEQCHDEIGKIKEIEAIAHKECAVINQFLRERGFDIQLDPWSDPQGFGMAAVLDLLVEWMEQGAITTITTADYQRFDGVRISKENRAFYTTPGHPNPIALITTKSGDKVYMTMTDRIPSESEFEAVKLVENLTKNLQPDYSWNGLVFPMVDLNQEVDIGWITKMASDPDDDPDHTFVVDQAIQQTKLKMDEKGAHVESAVALAMELTGPPQPSLPDHIIDKPFLIWFTRDSLAKPLFVGYIDRDVWKNPGGPRKDSGYPVISKPPSDTPIGHMDIRKIVQEEMKERLKHREE